METEALYCDKCWSVWEFDVSFAEARCPTCKGPVHLADIEDPQESRPLEPVVDSAFLGEPVVQWKNEVQKLKARLALAASDNQVLLDTVKLLCREIEYLRQYGNKDCIGQAEDAMKEGTLDDPS